MVGGGGSCCGNREEVVTKITSPKKERGSLCMFGFNHRPPYSILIGLMNKHDPGHTFIETHFLGKVPKEVAFIYESSLYDGVVGIADCLDTVNNNSVNAP